MICICDNFLYFFCVLWSIYLSRIWSWTIGSNSVMITFLFVLHPMVNLFVLKLNDWFNFSDKRFFRVMRVNACYCFFNIFFHIHAQSVLYLLLWQQAKNRTVHWARLTVIHWAHYETKRWKKRGWNRVELWNNGSFMHTSGANTRVEFSGVTLEIGWVGRYIIILSVLNVYL